METVAAFNSELSGLYESRPPISKAKMAAITKSAMRAIKFYKHVVQSVEKFILKCKPEYKVPGLYVIDSIVRQSRHQYGSDKDVFAPRFQRNLTETFANLFRCAPEDKSRIIRVLNLWQKNNVFKAEVIQPIFDLADPNHQIYHQMPPVSSMGGGSGNVGAGPSSSGALTLADISAGANGLNSSGLSTLDLSMNSSLGGPLGSDDKLGSITDLSLSSHEKCSRGIHESGSASRRHMEQHYMKRQHGIPASSTSSSKARSCFDSISSTGSGKLHHHKYSKSSHELDYSMRDIIDDEDDNMMLADDHHCLGDDSPPTSSNLLDKNNLKQLLSDPNVLRQLQTLQNLQKFKQQEESQKRYQDELHYQNALKGTAGMPPGMGMGMGHNDASDINKDVEFISEQQSIEVINLDGNDSRSPTPERDRYKRSRRSSRSRSRSPRGGGRGVGGASGAGGDRDRGSRRRGSSRSRSRTRSPRSSRRRSSRERDRDRMERSTRDKERDREHERERRKKGLPDIKKEHLSVCSTTLWVGHLSKLVYQEELSDTFGEYGDIVSIDQIVPRGCAFIVMNRRQDAHKAMQALKSHKLQGRAITISWAAGKGVKSKEWKDFWDLDLGVTYIPWNKLNLETDFDSLEEGGMFDEDTMPGWMKDKINQAKNKKDKPSITTGPGDLTGAGGVPTGPPPGLLFGIDTTQPPPVAPPHGGPGAPPPALMSMVPGQFSMAPPMGGPPPRMLGPMGPMNHPMAGLPMPPNMVGGMPPPMMMPPTIMPPGFPGMGGPPHPMAMPSSTQFPPPGAVPPPLGGPPSGGPNIGSIGGGGGSAVGIGAATSNVSSDDQMDIEMELEDAPTAPPPQPNFNQPPPLFTPGPGAPNNLEAAVVAAANELFQRERSRAGGAGVSRWGGRDDVSEAAERWRAENSGGAGGPAGIVGSGGAFNEARARLNLNPMELGMQQQRPDFMAVDFDNRAGPRGMGPRAGNHNGGGEFFQPNVNQNRFNQPTSLMQMRIPPPVAFMSGPGVGNGGNGGGPMFMRNQSGGGGGQGGRQQGPGFFNPRNPFNDNSRGRGGGRSMGGGGGRGGRWSDEEDDGNRRRGGNRFRDRDNSDDRRGGNARGGRNGPRDERDRGANRRGSRDDNRNSISAGEESNTRQAANAISASAESSDSTTLQVNKDQNQVPDSSNKPATTATDTEEDWDRELQEYDARMEAEHAAAAAAAAGAMIDPTVAGPDNTIVGETSGQAASEAALTTINSEPSINDAPTSTVFEMPTVEEGKVEIITKTATSQACTPLYDELPPSSTPVKIQPPMEVTKSPTPPPQAVVEAKATEPALAPLLTEAVSNAEEEKLPATEDSAEPVTA